MNSEEMTPGEPIQHPAAWRGSELASSSYWGMQLFDGGEPAAGFPEMANWFSDVQEELEHGKGAVLIKGEVFFRPLEDFADNAFRAFCAKIGTPISQSASGEKVFSVRDEGYAKDDARTRGPNTRNKLSFHTDRCDVIAFFAFNRPGVAEITRLSAA